jgi:hypothetical protein
VNQEIKTGFWTVVWWIALLVPLIPVQSRSTVVVPFKKLSFSLESDNRARYLNPNTGRFAGPGYNLDEYPFASSEQGGAKSRVSPVPVWQNCVQGGIIAACYRIEKILPGTSYYVVVLP